VDDCEEVVPVEAANLVFCIPLNAAALSPPPAIMVAAAIFMALCKVEEASCAVETTPLCRAAARVVIAHQCIGQSEKQCRLETIGRADIKPGTTMKIGITGVTGLIGRRVAALAREHGHEVIGFSRNPMHGGAEWRRFSTDEPPDIWRAKA